MERDQPNPKQFVSDGSPNSPNFIGRSRNTKEKSTDGDGSDRVTDGGEEGKELTLPSMAGKGKIKKKGELLAPPFLLPFIQETTASAPGESQPECRQ